jgi:hypothetical protein
MTMIHATDSEVQEYSLNTISNTGVAEHIKNCRQCSEKAVQYKLMFGAIEQQDAPAFDFNVNQLVMEQLAIKTVKHSTDKYFVYIGISVAACMLAILFYVIKTYLPSVLNGLTPLLIGLIVITALGVSLFIAMEMYSKFKIKMNALNFA